MTITQRTYGHGSITLTAYESSRRIRVEAIAENSVMDWHELFEFVDAIRKPQQVTTAEEMDKLRFQAVVLDAYGTPYVCERHATDGTRNEWRPAGMNHLDQSEDILYHGPATVVHAGEPDPATGATK